MYIAYVLYYIGQNYYLNKYCFSPPPRKEFLGTSRYIEIFNFVK